MRFSSASRDMPSIAAAVSQPPLIARIIDNRACLKFTTHPLTLWFKYYFLITTLSALKLGMECERVKFQFPHICRQQRHPHAHSSFLIAESRLRAPAERVRLPQQHHPGSPQRDRAHHHSPHTRTSRHRLGTLRCRPEGAEKSRTNHARPERRYRNPAHGARHS